jgi:hypothetical protein
MGKWFSMNHGGADRVGIFKPKTSSHFFDVGLLVKRYSPGNAIAGDTNSQDPFDGSEIRDLEVLL